VLVRDLERRLDRGGTVVGVEDAGLSRQARLLQQAFRQTHGGFVGGPRELHMVETQDLLRDGACQFGAPCARGG